MHSTYDGKRFHNLYPLVPDDREENRSDTRDALVIAQNIRDFQLTQVSVIVDLVPVPLPISPIIRFKKMMANRVTTICSQLRTWFFGIMAWGCLLACFFPRATPAAGCPFCSAVSQTFAEQMDSMQVVVLAKLLEAASYDENSTIGEIPPSKFEVLEVLRGVEEIQPKASIATSYFGVADKEATYLVMATNSPSLMWGSPILLSQPAAEYVKTVSSLPKESQRLKFFMHHLENPEELIANDAYDEFARAPYEDVKLLKTAMDRAQLMEWISKKGVSISRRRLYLTMLGVCGTSEDAAALETFMRDPSREAKAGLDAMVAAYISLLGESGLPLIEELFLKNKSADYMDTNSAILALRFHGNETDVVPRPRLVRSLRYVLERPELADLVIPDLARWQDWDALPEMVKLFKTADPKSNWVRVPVINFARACPLPEAEAAIQEFEQMDPEAVRRAGTLFPFAGMQPKPGSTAGGPPSPADVPVDARDTTAGSSNPDKQVPVNRIVLVTCLVVMMMGAASIILLTPARSRNPVPTAVPTSSDPHS